MNAVAPESLPSLQSRDQAERTLERIRYQTGLLGVAVAARDQDVASALAKRAALIKKLNDDITQDKSRLEQWAWANRKNEFEGEQTLDLKAGRLSFRKGQRACDLYYGWTWEKVLEKLESFGPTHFFAQFIRRKPEVDKRKILKEAAKPRTALAAARLKEIGVKIVQEERFDISLRPPEPIGAMVV